MYTSYIGQKFLKIYREKMGKSADYSAEQFFDEVQFPLFFCHDLHLMHVGNSPFFQKPRAEDIAQYGSAPLAQYQKLKHDIRHDAPNMAIYVGYGAKDLNGTTSGQMTSMPMQIAPDELYASWIGQALAIGVNGGYLMLIDEPDILWALFSGWSHYREYLAKTPRLKGRQIETWNGNWIKHCLSRHYDEAYPMDGFRPELTDKEKEVSIDTQAWTGILFALARTFPNRVLTAYAYALSQTNITLGFINLYLPEVMGLYDLRDKIFIDGQQVVLSDAEIEALEPAFGFHRACTMGSIGLKAIEPARLRDFFPSGTPDAKKAGKEFKIDVNSKNISLFNLYKLWIVAMLNKTELLNTAANVAQLLLQAESKGNNRGKTTDSQAVKTLLEAKTVKNVVEALSYFLNEDNNDLLRATVKEVVHMPTDALPLFITLIKFEYQSQKLKN